jgi:hypothetical protein
MRKLRFKDRGDPARGRSRSDDECRKRYGVAERTIYAWHKRFPNWSKGRPVRDGATAPRGQPAVARPPVAAS